MKFQIPKPKDNYKIAKNLKFNYYELDEIANQKYGNSFSELSIKEQDEISRKVAKGFHYQVDK